MFITLEGIEGSGKTTQLKNIVAFLKTRGYDCVTTREPGGTPIGKQVRGILLDPENHGLKPEAELMLYMADRIQHIQALIKPNLAAGRVVVCDRYFDATVVYQGYARGLDLTLIRSLHHLVCADLQPDLTLLFDLDPEIGLARAWRQLNSGGRIEHEARFETEKMEFHQKVRMGYLELARMQPHRFKVVDASMTPEKVAASVETALAAFFSMDR
jgi:dTMP kinase